MKFDSGISNKFSIRYMKESDVASILELCKGNPLYYRYCPPSPTLKSIEEDLTALPPNTLPDCKHYIGFYDDDKLIAVMDFIDGYPEKDIAFIGFFMTDQSIQGKGVGSEIIKELVSYLNKLDKFSSIRLAWENGNPQSEHFWVKNGFAPISEVKSTVGHNVVLAEYKL